MHRIHNHNVMQFVVHAAHIYIICIIYHRHHRSCAHLTPLQYIDRIAIANILGVYI